jgi:hypothetical protein
MQMGLMTKELVSSSNLSVHHPFKAEINSLRVTLPDEIFHWGFSFLNRTFR